MRIKTDIEKMIYSGKLDGFVIYKDPRFTGLIARRYVKPKLTQANINFGYKIKIISNRFHGLSPDQLQDLEMLKERLGYKMSLYHLFVKQLFAYEQRSELFQITNLTEELLEQIWQDILL